MKPLFSLVCRLSSTLDISANNLDTFCELNARYLQVDCFGYLAYGGDMVSLIDKVIDRMIALMIVLMIVIDIFLIKINV